jgi:hypothetical protein
MEAQAEAAISGEIPELAAPKFPFATDGASSYGAELNMLVGSAAAP